MKGDWDDCRGNDLGRKYHGGDTLPKIKTLLADLLEKEEELVVYKDRLEELEVAFYYNLELISERDLELSVLEKQLASEYEDSSGETVQLQAITRERDELEDLLKKLDDKQCRKIQQLETRLSLKEEEIHELQRENMKNVTHLKRVLDGVKHQQEKKVHELRTGYETEKKLHKNCREEMEEKEKRFLLEIDNLSQKLEQAWREKEATEEENDSLRHQLVAVERLFEEKESYYLEHIQKTRRSPRGRAHKEVQCCASSQVCDKKIQAGPEITAADSQTLPNVPGEDHLSKRIAFLQEQNEVLKCVIKDMKKNHGETLKSETPEGCRECSAVKAEFRQVSKNVETEISNFKRVLEADQKQRDEEEALIQSLEASVASLKDKFLAGLQEKLKDFSGEDICSYTYNREIQTEIQVSLLEEKFTNKINALMTLAEEERQKVNDKLEELKKECFEMMEQHLKSREEPTQEQGEKLLQKIREEILRLENKMGSGVRSVIESNCDKTCERTFYAGSEGWPPQRLPLPAVLSPRRATPEKGTSRDRGDFSLENCLSITKCSRGLRPRRQGSVRRLVSSFPPGR